MYALLFVLGKVPWVWFTPFVDVITMFAPISFTFNPSIVLINVFAFAVGVPVVVSTKSTVLVVADVLIIFAGAIKLPLASTGSSYFNPTLL